MLEFQVLRIKLLLFFNLHKLSEGIQRFSPDIEILQRDNFVEHDLKLIQHEYFESKVEGIFKTDYITAYKFTDDTGRTWNPREFDTTPEMRWRP